MSHTGIVEKVDGSKVYTIEGNTSDQVARRSYALGSSRIVGYGRSAYDAESGSSAVPAAATKYYMWTSMTASRISLPSAQVA